MAVAGNNNIRMIIDSEMEIFATTAILLINTNIGKRINSARLCVCISVVYDLLKDAI